MRLHGTRALITGGSCGLGLAYAEALAGAGCSLVLTHLGEAASAAQAAARLAANHGVSVDAAERDVGEGATARSLVRDAVARLGGLDGVVSNAGICKFTPSLELTDKDWHRHVAVNLHAGFYVGQEATRLMVEQGKGGRIVYTTSVGAFRSNGTQTHDCSTKAGLSLLPQGLALLKEAWWCWPASTVSRVDPRRYEGVATPMA